MVLVLVLAYQYAVNSGGLDVTKQSSLKANRGVIIARTYERNATSARKSVPRTSNKYLFLLNRT